MRVDESLIERYARDPGSLDPDTRAAVRGAIEASEDAAAVYGFWAEFERTCADSPVAPASFDAAADLADRIAGHAARIVPLQPWEGTLHRRAPVAMAAQSVPAPSRARFRPLRVLATPDQDRVVRLLFDTVDLRIEAYLLGAQDDAGITALVLDEGHRRLVFDAAGRASLECPSEADAETWVRRADLEVG